VDQARRLASRRVYEGRIVRLDVDEVEEPGGIRAVREVVRHGGSVAVLPVHDDGRVVLISQYRYGVGAAVLEVPAGRLEPGERPEQAARRELEEEVGLRAGELTPLLTLHTTPGFCDERIHLYRAAQLEVVPPRPDADERITALTLELGDARERLDREEVRDAKTLVALLIEEERRR
jgi:ADP-ribose pyrophosphatase